MSTSTSEFPRGSEWRQWDLHIHTPASFHWNGSRFDSDPNSAHNIALIDQMIAALNAAQPAVFAIMDYWTFEGWFALKRRLKQQGAPVLNKKVFPGIELRLAAPTTCRLNAHVLFSDEIEDQALRDFQAALKVEIINRPLSEDSLRTLARAVGADLLQKNGFKKTDVDSDNDIALKAGATIAEINCDSYKLAIEQVPNGQAIGFMPYDTSDGLSEVKWQDHYAYFIGLFKTSPIFETRNSDLRGAFVNEETSGNANWIRHFQAGLGDIPRLAVSGSDAHRFTGTKGDNNNRGYGDFPSGKITWIKADPTFRGLLQAIKEPAKRSYIGERPPKLIEVNENKTFYIDSINISKINGSALTENWLSGCNLSLNSDLIAIIGNKGSGKSALADIIALLGNSKQTKHFSFLKKDRFRGKTGEPAKQFEGKLKWCDGVEGDTRRLSDDPEEDKAELVRYIPQGHFEGLCNDHVSGKTDSFEQELRAVIFSHASKDITLGALDFDQLIQRQESSFRDQLVDSRKNLSKLNQDICEIEDQLQPDLKSSLLELLELKKRQIEEHQKIKPADMTAPSEQLSPEQQKAATDIAAITEKMGSLDADKAQHNFELENLAAKLKSAYSVRERIRLLQRQINQSLEDIKPDLELLSIAPESIIDLRIDESPISAVISATPAAQESLKNSIAKIETEKAALAVNKNNLNNQLNAPQLEYHKYLTELEAWQKKLNELLGTPDSPNTQKGIEARIEQIEKLPQVLKEKEQARIKLCGDIFDILELQRKAREELFKPVQDLIQSNSLIREDYKLQFLATLSSTHEILCSALFDLIKQNSGEFRGEDESYSAVRTVYEKYNMNNRQDVINFATEMHNKIVTAANGSANNCVGISSILRKDKAASSVYDLLFGLETLEPRYSLLFQDAQIEQLSPGQRGALLLIFYLLVDKGRTPIILDQPEENLDNETVVSLLVPVLSEAKKKRQIMMVTHNPNLAVVCDAEQVIHASFNRKNESTITYYAGSIENPVTNQKVVTVLEGTKPAFDNRKSKYH